MKKKPKYYPVIKQVYILRKFCSVNGHPNRPESLRFSDLIGRL